MEDRSMYPDPVPYGDDFYSAAAIIAAVDQRMIAGEPLFGHAVLWEPVPGSDTLYNRIGVTVTATGDIMFGAHGEWI